MGFVSQILIPTDFSKNAEKAMDFAMKLASDCHATLHLLHVDDDPLLNSPTTSEEFRSKYEDRMATTLASMMDDEQRRKFSTEFAVTRGDAAGSIVEYAQEHNIDVIVIGTKGRSAISDMFLGSVAAKVLRQATCPVMSVRS